MNRRKLIILTMILSPIIVFLLFSISFSIKYIKLLHVSYPDEPMAFGNFPQGVVWIYSASSKVTSTPIFHNGKVFIRSTDSICALEAVDGKGLWCSTSISDSPTSLSPIIIKDLIIVPENKTDIAAFSIENGELIWRNELKNDDTDLRGQHWIKSIIAYENLVFVARYDYALTSYFVESGKINWSVGVPSHSDLFLAADSNHVILSAGEILSSYQPATGNLMWELEATYFENKSDVLFSPILINDGILYVTLSFGESCVISLDLNTMQEVWRVSISESTINDPTKIESEGNFLFVAGRKLVSLIKKTGEINCIGKENKWSLESPVMYKNNVFIRDIYTTLYLLDSNSCKITGGLRIQMNTPMNLEPERGPAIALNLLLVPFGDNRVFAYKIE